MTEPPRYRALIFVEGEANHMVAYFWTIPRKGETVHLEQSEMFIEVVSVMHYAYATYGHQGWEPNPDEPEVHIKISAKPAR